MPEQVNQPDDLTPTTRLAYALDQAVGAIYRVLGADVQHDPVLAGFQLDLLVKFEVSPGKVSRFAVVCKSYSKLVGLSTMERFVQQIDLLRQLNLVDGGIIVSTSGFTKNALKSAKEHQVKAIKFFDLKTKVREKEDELFRSVESIFEGAENRKKARVKQVFVVMPFAKRFDDIYVIGIREVAERLGWAVERADDVQSNAQILELIQQKLRDAALVIADLSTANPNVFYEVGYAHAVGTDTILLSDATERTPFDLQSFNQVRYESLIDLRTKLEARMRGMLRSV